MLSHNGPDKKTVKIPTRFCSLIKTRSIQNLPPSMALFNTVDSQKIND